MTVLEYYQLRDAEPWMKLPDYTLLGEVGVQSVRETSVEEAKVKRLSKILSCAFVSKEGFCMNYPKP